MASSLSSVITSHVVFTVTDFKVFVYFFRNICFPKPVHLIKCCIMQRISLETIISAHIALIHVQYCFEAKSSLSVPHTLHPSPPLAFFLPIICFFSFHFFLSSVILFISLTLTSFLLSSVGRLLIEFSSQMTMERVQKENPNVTEGGRYMPPDCRPRWKVGIYASQSVFHVF